MYARCATLHCIICINTSLLCLQAKYSPLHTCRVQLLGLGRYVLMPPAKHSSLYLYPAIHAAHQQSQVPAPVTVTCTLLCSALNKK